MSKCVLLIAAVLSFAGCKSAPSKSAAPAPTGGSSCQPPGAPCAGLGPNACCPGTYCNASITMQGMCCYPATKFNPCPTTPPDGGN